MGSNPRILRCEHCRVWYTVNRVIPDVCPYCEKSAMWKTAEALLPAETKPWKLTRDDRDFLRTNKIDPDGPDVDEDDGA